MRRVAGSEPLRALMLDAVDDWTGVSNWMTALGAHLVRRGHHVVACGRPGSGLLDACREHELPTVELRLRGDFHPRDVWTLQRLYRASAVDLAIVHTRRALRTAWAARLLLWGPGPAILCRLGDRVIKRSLGAGLTYRHMADRYITPSEATRQALLRAGYFTADRIRAIPNGVCFPPEAPGVRERVRSELALGDGPVLIVTSRLHHQKGHRHLFDAAALLREDFPALCLLVVGEGRQRAEVEAHARRAGVAAAVRFLGFRADVTDLLRAADLFVLPSLLEGLPHTVLEAMAVGLPVVGTAVDGVAEAVADGETGLLVPAADPKALAGAIGRLLADPPLAARMGRAGRERVAADFALDRTLADGEAYCIETRDARYRHGHHRRGGDT
ncbi:glycosyltransferase family 4 protein [Planctomycetota bacterium]